MSEAIELRKAGTDPLELDMMQLGRVLAQSGFFADSREAAQAVVKVLAGRELGFGPIASMRGVNIIKGKVSLAADLQAAAIKSSGKYDYHVIQHDTERCRIRFFQGAEDIGDSEFTMSDARAAGLLSNDTWRKYPRNMLFARAMSNGARWYCPDVFGGAVYTPEEMGAKVDEEGSVVEVGDVAPIRSTEENPTESPNVQIEGNVIVPEPKRAKKATNPQLKKLAVLAGNFGWDDEERRRRAGVASFTELTFDQAHVLIEAWEAAEEPPFETSGDVADPGKEPVGSPEDVEGAGGEASPPASGQPPAPTASDDQPATTEHLNRLSEVFGGASKALLAARQMFGPEITSVSMLTTAQATKLFEEKLPS